MKQAKTQNLQRNTKYPTSYIIGLIGGVALFIPSLILAHAHQLSGLQARLFYDVNNFHNGLTTPALIITEGLGAAYPIAVCVLLPLVFKRVRLAWRFLVTVGATGVIMEAAKLIAKEPRPVALLHGKLHARASEAGLTSFPSGHEAIATAMALTLWFILPRRWRWVSILWIIVVGVSRVYLGVHSFNDIIGGFAIGLAVTAAIRLLPPALTRPLKLDRPNDLLEKYSRHQQPAAKQ